MQMFTGHDHANDSLFDGIAPQEGRQRDETYYGGYSSSVVRNPDGTYSYVPVTGADDAAGRFQQMGAEGRAIDYNAANSDRMRALDARAGQGEAIGLIRDAAYGNAPSQAQLLGQKMTDDSIAASASMAASSRGGPMGAAAALRTAGRNAAIERQRGNQMAMAQRADEMATARNQLMGGTSTMRQQDYGAAQQAAGMSQAQSMLDEQRQQYYEGMGHDVRTGGVHAGLAKAGLSEGARQFDQGARERRQSREDAQVGAVMEGFGSLATMIPTGSKPSDIHSKRDVQPMGRHAPMGELEPWLPPNAFPSYSLISDKRAKRDERMMGQAEGMMAGYKAALSEPPSVQPALDRTRAENPVPFYTGGHDGLVRENPYGENPVTSGGGIVRENPYGEAPTQAPAGPSSGQRFGGALMSGMGRMGGRMASMGPGPMGPPSSAPTVNYRDYMQISDDRAKLIQAFEAGRSSAAPPAPREKRTAEIVTGRPETFKQMTTTQRGGLAIDPNARGTTKGVDKERPEREPREAPPADDGKTSAMDPRRAPPAEMMDAIGSGIAFNYRDGTGEDPSKRHFGTTTQDLRSTPMGASMVEPHPTGYDAINVREAVGPTLASLGNLNERLRELEERKRRGRKA